MPLRWWWRRGTTRHVGPRAPRRSWPSGGTSGTASSFFRLSPGSFNCCQFGHPRSVAFGSRGPVHQLAAAHPGAMARPHRPCDIHPPQLILRRPKPHPQRLADFPRRGRRLGQEGEDPFDGVPRVRPSLQRLNAAVQDLCLAILVRHPPLVHLDRHERRVVPLIRHRPTNHGSGWAPRLVVQVVRTGPCGTAVGDGTDNHQWALKGWGPAGAPSSTRRDRERGN